MTGRQIEREETSGACIGLQIEKFSHVKNNIYLQVQLVGPQML